MLVSRADDIAIKPPGTVNDVATDVEISPHVTLDAGKHTSRNHLWDFFVADNAEKPHCGLMRGDEKFASMAIELHEIAAALAKMLNEREKLLDMVDNLDAYLREIRAENLDGSEPNLGELLEESLQLRLTCESESAVPPRDHENIVAIPRFSLMYSGNNPNGYIAEASRTGDTGIYEEVRISVFNPNRDNTCVGDVLVGLTKSGELRALVTANGDGDGDHRIAVYPLRPADQAVELSDRDGF